MFWWLCCNSICNLPTTLTRFKVAVSLIKAQVPGVGCCTLITSWVNDDCHCWLMRVCWRPKTRCLPSLSLTLSSPFFSMTTVMDSTPCCTTKDCSVTCTGTCWVMTVLSSALKNISNSWSAFTATSNNPSVAWAIAPRVALSALWDKPTVCTRAPTLMYCCRIGPSRAVRARLFFAASLLTSTIPSVNNMTCNCLPWTWSWVLNEAALRAAPMSVNWPLEEIFWVAAEACFCHWAFTTPWGTMTLGSSANCQIPALLPAGNSCVNTCKAGMRNLLGSVSFMLPDTSINTRISISLDKGWLMVGCV